MDHLTTEVRWVGVQVLTSLFACLGGPSKLLCLWEPEVFLFGMFWEELKAGSQLHGSVQLVCGYEGFMSALIREKCPLAKPR